MRNTLPFWATILLVACTRTPGPEHPPIPPTPVQLEQAAANGEHLFARYEAANAWNDARCEQVADAFHEARDAVHRPPPNFVARSLYMESTAVSRCGDTAQQAELLEAALGADADFCEARVAQGLMQLEQNAARARATFEQAVRQNPQCALGYLNLAILQTDIPAERDEALRNARRALAIRSDLMPALNQMALIYLATTGAEPARLDLAAIVCQQAFIIDENYAPLYNTWGLVALERDELTEASRKFSRARELDPELFEAHMNFAQLALSQRAYTDAAEAFETARALRPQSYDASIGLGIALRALRRTDESERLYRAAIAIDDARPDAYFNLGVLYQDHREGTVAQLQRAEEFYREFTARARTQHVYADSLRRVLLWCPQSRRRGCRPGRAQNLHDSLVGLEARAESARPAWTRGS